MKCRYCGESFKGMSLECAGVSVEQWYCSDECRVKAYKEYKRQERISIYNDRRLTCVQDGLLPPWFIDHVKVWNQQRKGYKIATNTRSCCWICGFTGRGKSYLARLIIQHHLSKNTRCAFETAKNLFQDDKRYKTLQYVPVLCIDDIHKCSFGEYTANLFHDCLSVREGLRLRTLITSEPDIHTFAKEFTSVGHAALARLDCCGKRVDIEMVGENLRRA